MAGRSERTFRDDDYSNRGDDYPRARPPRAEQRDPDDGRRPELEEMRGPDDDRREGEGGPRARMRPGNGGRRRPYPTLPSPEAISDTYAMAIERGAALLGDNVRNLQNETARFLSRRVESDMQAMQDMARSRSLIELFGVQQRWFSTLARDYSEEMIRFARVTNSAVQDTAAAAGEMREH
jgi:hypothetical protein